MQTNILSYEARLTPVSELIVHPRNARKHADRAIDDSIQANGFYKPVVASKRSGYVLAGNGTLARAVAAGYTELPVHWLEGLSEAEELRILAADNKTSDLSPGYDDQKLAELLDSIRAETGNFAGTGYDSEQFDRLIENLGNEAIPGQQRDDVVQERDDVHEPSPETESSAEGDSKPDQLAELHAKWNVQPGEIWAIGRHRLICGDCRDRETVERLFAGVQANIAITSPPYASQRKYDEGSGFKPIPPDEYVPWYRAVAQRIEENLAPDGSYFLNIKEHADDGERSLYVKDLAIAHRRLWGWRFVDEFCWRKTDNGVPGGWPNRFKNAWEPVFHFCRNKQIKLRPEAVGHKSEACFDYSPSNPKSTSGSGLLGTGARGDAAEKNGSSDNAGRHEGIARPSNVIEVKTESSQGLHSAPYPRKLVEFFVLAFSDPGDVVFDPFMGSGTTMAAAEALGRAGYGCEISPQYCAVILERLSKNGAAPARVG